jgi:hypothetical protein
MEDRFWVYALAGFLQPFFWAFVLGLALWLTRKLFPAAERYLFAPLPVTANLIGQRLRRLRLRGSASAPSPE